MTSSIPDSLKWFRHPHSRDVYFIVKDGEVVGNKIWSETHIHGSGGGVQTYGNTLEVKPVRISSSVDTKQEIWVRSPEGTEFSIRTSDGVSVNIGQQVSILAAGTPQQGEAFVLINRTAKRWYVIGKSLADFFLDRFYIRTKVFGFIRGFVLPIILVIAFLATGLLYNEASNGRYTSLVKTFYGAIFYFTLAAIFAMVWLGWRRIAGWNTKRDEAAQAYTQHCSNIVQMISQP